MFELLKARAERHRFDLFGTFSIADYNRAVPADFRLDIKASQSRAVIIGNTRQLWPRFVAAIRATPSLLDGDDPFDTWVETEVEALLDGMDAEIAVYYAHSRPPQQVAIQHMAALAGLAWLSPSYLTIHPVYGPWISWRAVFVLPDSERTPVVESVPVLPCHHCDRQCMPALNMALRETKTADFSGVRHSWKPWLAVRDACEEGHAWRFCSDQIEYHYTADVEVLRRIISS
ncbi:MAG: hypothetical protein VX223_10010 [Myxococcota bacterium]|nr:hypothetical protein [Myxococcota bacterium]